MDIGSLALQNIQVGSGGQEAERTAQKLSSLAEPKDGDFAAIRKAAQEFEGYFVAYLMKVMRETVPHGLFENKYGEQFYYFYDQEIGRLAAERGGLGFGTMVLEHYGQQQAEGNLKNPLKSSVDSSDMEDEPVKSQGGVNWPRSQG